MQDYMEVRKAAIYAAFQHGRIDDDEATRELLAVEREARDGRWGALERWPPPSPSDDGATPPDTGPT